MASLLINTALQLLVLGALLGGGHLALRWCGLERFDGSLRPAAIPLPVVLAAGIVWWSVLLFVLATLGLYRAPVLRALTLLGAAAGLLYLFRRWRQRRPIGESAQQAGATDGWFLRLALVAVAVVSMTALASLWLQAHRPDVSWDANVYHLEIPKRLLQDGGWRAFDWNVYGNWPHAVQLLWGTALAWGRHEGAKLLHWSFAVATILLIATLGSGTRPGPALARLPWLLLATVLYLSHPVVLYEARIAYVDLAHGLLLLAAFWALERCLALNPAASASPSDPTHRGGHRLFGLLLAGLVAVKLNGFFGVGFLLLLWLLHTERRSAARLVAILLPVGLVGAGWLAKTAWWTGNPFHPVFWKWFGGPNWSAALAAQHGAWQRSMGPGREPLDWLLLLWRVLTQGDRGYAHFDGELSLILLPALALALLGAQRNGTARRALLLAAALFASWALTSQQMRLLLPALPLVCVATLQGIRSLRSTSRRAVALGLALAGGIALTTSSWVYVEQTARLARDLTSGGSQLRATVVPPAIRFLNDELERSDTVLLIGTNHAFFVEPLVIADSFFEASQIRWAFRDCADPVQAARRARELGVTHVLWAAAGDRFPYPPGLSQLPDLARSSNAVVFRDEGAMVIRINALVDEVPPRARPRRN